MVKDPDKSKRRPTWATVVCVLLTLVVLYFLSSGPAVALTLKWGDTNASSLVLDFYSPVFWLEENTPIGPVIKNYVGLWIVLLVDLEALDCGCG